MKILNNMKGKKGFTLIELLAVIVVLAIVSVLGASLILPAIANARKNAFVIEANNVLDAAAKGASLFQVGQISPTELTEAGAKHYLGADNAGSGYKEGFCFTILSLVKLNLFDKKDLTSDGYKGKVVIQIPDSTIKSYLYKTTMYTDRFMITNVSGTVKNSDVTELDKASTTSVTCPDKLS